MLPRLQQETTALQRVLLATLVDAYEFMPVVSKNRGAPRWLIVQGGGGTSTRDLELFKTVLHPSLVSRKGVTLARAFDFR